MEQIERLRNILSESEISKFKNYSVSKGDLKFLNEYIVGILSKIKSEPFKCASLSSLLGVIIKENSNIPVVVVSGELRYLNNIVFDGREQIPFNSNVKIINRDWFGHAWVECPNFIIDISLKRTVSFRGVSKELNNVIGSEEYILDSYKNIKSLKLDYNPRYLLNEQLKDGLIKSINIR
ncbi:hypothetical protein [Tenacibaculum halocynthiae]|uniref:hypothetical protein n=1 Tax=Tenacibaculum halocynthiae TaxID=1254437 RepID=UPI003D660670